MRTRAALALAAVALAAGLAGCAAPADEAASAPSAGAEQAGEPTELDGLVPGQTIPASGLPAADAAGMTAGIVVAGDGAAATELADDAAAEGMSAEVFDGEAALDDALAATPDVIVCAGGALLPDLESLTAQALDQRFVLLGMQLLEPTENVAAVIWSGHDSLRSDAAVPADRLDEALTAGLAASATIPVEIVVDLDR